MKSLIAVFSLVCTLAALAGCAHNHGNNYAYAPPYAPPVYPQPPGVAQPVSYAAPVAGAPVVGAPGPAPAGVMVKPRRVPKGAPTAWSWGPRESSREAARRRRVRPAHEAARTPGRV
jgi:hypothetical protein